MLILEDLSIEVPDTNAHHWDIKNLSDGDNKTVLMSYLVENKNMTKLKNLMIAVIMITSMSTAAFAGPEIQEIREVQPGVSEAEAIIKGLGSAAAETVFSSIGTGTIGRVYKDNNMSDKFNDYMVKFNMIEEGIELV